MMSGGTSDEGVLPIYDPSDPAVINDPLPILRVLQAEDPVHWSERLRGWLITRHEDVRKVQVNESVSADRLTPFYKSLPSDQQAAVSELLRYLNTWVAFKDPPEHTRLRRLMKTVFTPSLVGMREKVERTVGILLDDIRDRDTIDFVEDFAYPLPAMVIMSLLGLPPSDMNMLKDLSNKIQLFIGSATRSSGKYAVAQEGAIEMAEYFRRVILERERAPEGEDMISRLLSLRAEGSIITEDEVIGTAMLLLFAGHETTTNLIGNGLRALLQHPAELEQLRSDPTMIGSAIEEMLRYDGPTGALVRVVGVTHNMHGRELRSGDRIFLMVHAANHDPRVFDQPEEFRISRSPNPHLTFNYGPHFCLGAPLARMEGSIAIASFMERFPELRLMSDQVQYMDTLVMRGVRHMPVALRR